MEKVTLGLTFQGKHLSKLYLTVSIQNGASNMDGTWYPVVKYAFRNCDIYPAHLVNMGG